MTVKRARLSVLSRLDTRRRRGARTEIVECGAAHKHGHIPADVSAAWRQSQDVRTAVARTPCLRNSWQTYIEDDLALPICVCRWCCGTGQGGTAHDRERVERVLLSGRNRVATAQRDVTVENLETPGSRFHRRAAVIGVSRVTFWQGPKNDRYGAMFL